MRRASVRLLREDNLRIEGEESQAYVRLGHDALAKVAAAWRAEREKQEQLLDHERKRRWYLIGGLVVSVVLAAIFALGGLQIYQNNLELGRKNRELDQTNTALKTAEAKAKTEAENASIAEEAAKRDLSFVENMFELADPYKAKGQTITAREILDQGAQKVNELKGQPLHQAELLETIGNVYRRLAIYDRAEQLLEDSLKIREEKLGEGHSLSAQSLNNLAELFYARGTTPSPSPSSRRH